MIHKLDTGYQPQEADLSAIDKKALFNAFARSRYMLRKVVRSSSSIRSNLTEWRKEAQYATRHGDLALLRETREKIQNIEAWLSDEQRKYETFFAGFLLDLAFWIDKVATLDEKAALLGLSTTAARRELESYSEDGWESFTALLSHMPESHSDFDIETRVTRAIVDRIMADPVADRQVTKELNGLFGQELFPVPSVPKPTLAK